MTQKALLLSAIFSTNKDKKNNPFTRKLRTKSRNGWHGSVSNHCASCQTWIKTCWMSGKKDIGVTRTIHIVRETIGNKPKLELNYCLILF